MDARGVIRDHDAPDEILDQLRAICLALPDAYEEEAWAGTRWCVRKKNFAHVVRVDRGRPEGYASAAGMEGAITLTFRSSGPELNVLANSPHPFFKPVWTATVVGLVIDDDTDWDEVQELLTESYCALAPKKLVALVDRPSAPGDPGDGGLKAGRAMRPRARRGTPDGRSATSTTARC